MTNKLQKKAENGIRSPNSSKRSNVRKSKKYQHSGAFDFNFIILSERGYKDGLDEYTLKTFKIREGRNPRKLLSSKIESNSLTIAKNARKRRSAPQQLQKGEC